MSTSGATGREEDAEVANGDGDDGSVGKASATTASGWFTRTAATPVRGRAAIEDRVGECHAAARGGRLLTIVNGRRRGRR